MRRIGALVVVLALVMGGCSGVISDPNAGSIRDIAIGVDEHGVPTLEYPEGLEYSRVQTRVEWSGDGDRMNPGDRILVDMYSISLDTGAVLTNTFIDLPIDWILAPEVTGQPLYDVLVTERVGARILLVSPPVEGYEGQGAFAVVVDVHPAQAEGKEMPPREGLPTVRVAPDGEPTIEINAETPPPTVLEMALLVQGTGEQIREGSFFMANCKAVSYETSEVFYTTWDLPKVITEQIGSGNIVPGLEQGLIGQSERSRVLLIIPPELGYPAEGTLVWVVDILAVWTPE